LSASCPKVDRAIKNEAERDVKVTEFRVLIDASPENGVLLVITS
jgi:hypothetical protein